MNLEPILWGFVVVGGIAFVLFAWKSLGEKASEKKRRKSLEVDIEARISQTQSGSEEMVRSYGISKVISQISTQFINLRPSQFEKEIPLALGRFCTAINPRNI